MRLPSPFEPDRFGVALCTVAGLMNLVVMIDAYTVAEEAGEPKTGAAATGAQEATA